MKLCRILSVPLLASGLAGATTITVGNTAGIPLKPAPMNGTVLPIWYSPEKVKALTPGMQRGGFALFRYPNGTLSNEYHWNGEGKYDSVGIWHPSSTVFKPGFKADSRYRGTNRNNYGSVFPSMVIDNDTTNFWWGVAEQDSIEPWLIMKPSKTSIDSVVIYWGDIRPDSVLLSGTTGDPMWSNSAVWSAPVTLPVTGNRTQVKLATAVKGSWLSFRFPGKQGAQVREIRYFSAGKIASGNSATSRTQVMAMGTHPGNEPTTESPSRWDFDTFMAQLNTDFPGFEPLISVNVGTGTPEEAAAWVAYANFTKKYGIKRWNIGNEIDGNWEQGGPLDPAQYAARYLQFVKAMKAVDPSIEVYGPVLSTMDFQNRPSGRGPTNWMELFIQRVAAAERADNARYLDGIDFHAYPYYISSGSGEATEMLTAMDRLGGQLDTLNRYINSYLSSPETRKVAMTEFNASVSITHLLMDQTNGIGMANMLGHMASRFGNRAVTVAWEPAGGEPMNPDGSSGATYGSLRLFTPNRQGLTTDIGDAPTGAFWGQYLATQSWIERGRTSGNPTSLPVNVTGNGNVRAFALTDSGITSVMVLNLDSLADSVEVPNVAQASGEVLSWSGRDYQWQGTDWKARAIPNLGPSATPWTGGKVALPGFGALVFRGAPLVRAKTPVEMLLRTQSSSVLRKGDTLTVTASLRSKGSALRGATVHYPGLTAPVELAAWDGAWNGSHDGLVWRIPVDQLQLGDNLLQFTYQNADTTLLDTVRIKITDTLRASAWIDRFDNGKKTAELPTNPKWNVWAANGAPESWIQATEPLWPDTTTNKRSFRAEFEVQQPDGLGYDNFVAAVLPVPRKWLDTTSTRWAGVTFDWNAKLDSGSTYFRMHMPTDAILDYDDHLVSLEETGGTWVRKTLLWSDFTQSGWGKAVGSMDLATLIRIEFRAQGAGGGVFQIDNLALLGTAGDPLVLAVKKPIHASNWLIQRRGNMLEIESPMGATSARVRLVDLSGRVLYQGTGVGNLRVPLPRAGMSVLELQSGSQSERRMIHPLR